ncbi:MAG: protein kinase [Chloroflexi bacterium]|nr:protein kinase [Chloroflexota bacterium]
MSTDLPRHTSTRLQGSWLGAARVAQLAIMVLTMILYAAGITPTFTEVRRVVLGYEDALLQFNLSVDSFANYFLILELAKMAAFLTTAAVIFWRRSEDWMAIFLSLMLVTFGANVVSGVISTLGGGQPAWRLPADFVVVFGQVSVVVFFFLFPDGRFVPRWTRWLALIWAGWMLIAIFFPPAGPRTWPFPVIFLVLLVAYGSALLAQLYRYVRHASPLQRQQTKWVVFGLGVAVFLGWIIPLLPGVIFPALSQPTSPGLLYIGISSTLSVISVSLMPISLGFAILRHRLWDIDFVINRSLVYGALTIVLVALSGGSLLLISLVFQNLGGGQQSVIALVSAALIFGAVFQPIRRRLQSFVDRRFYSIQIDYQKTPAPAATSVTSVIKQTGFGEYQGLELIGRGGMAEIYKSTHPTLGVPVAIKVLPAHLTTDPDFRKRFTREAETMAKLQHPNIIRVFDFGEWGGTHYMVMEYVAGNDLGHRLTQQGHLPFTEVVSILKGVASALDYAHAQGLVHRDIKPSNILIENAPPNLNPKLTDFGIAKIIGNATRYTRTGGVLGTFDYIAPEQIRGAANIDRRADIYAFGIVTYQMLTGQLPFQHNNPGALLIAHMTQPPPDPRDVVPEISVETARAIRRAMAKNPDERYSTAGEFVNALQ